jgi:hypothetical protein
LAIGLKYGKGSGDPEDKKLETYMKTRQLFNEFVGLNGSSSCRELLRGLDMNDPDDYKKIIDQGLFGTSCEKYVADSVNITERLLR